MKRDYVVLVLMLCVVFAAAAGCDGSATLTTTASDGTDATTGEPGEIPASTAAEPADGTETTAGEPEETSSTGPESTTTSATEPPTTATTAAPPAPMVWTDLHPSGPTPPKREGAAMVCNPKTGRVILFGGWNWTTYLNDFWVYNPDDNVWISLSPAGGPPAARKGHTLVYESVNGKVLLFGGANGSGERNDLWAYSPPGDTWTQLAPAGGPPPSRKGHCAFFDPKTGKMYVFGGSQGGSRMDDLWAYDVAANTWSKLTPGGSKPAAREYASMAYNPNSGRAFLWGGYNGADLDDAWAYDPPSNKWIAIPLSGAAPSGRSFSPLTYVSQGKRMILFGGIEQAGEIKRDTWAFTPATGAWTKLTPGGDLPSGRANHSLTFATKAGKVILFGGTNDEVLFNDTWAYGPAD